MDAARTPGPPDPVEAEADPMESPTPIAVTAATAPVARAARRPPPALAYLGVLVLLGVVAVSPALVRPVAFHGLPDDVDVRAARALVAGRVGVDAGPLRWQSALLGASSLEPGASPAAAPDPASLGRAAALLERARVRSPRDPRVTAACAALDLARGDLGRAERRYQAAIDQGGRFSEARLGLGLTLALRAGHEADAARRRGLVLRAIGQFAAVPVGDPDHLPALYNRALLLARVGRSEEAHACARDYFARDPDSPWAERLARAVARG